MKKLSFAMALVMILAICASTLCFTVSAADNYAATTVAVMTDANGVTTEYDDLSKAIDAYKGGETIKLVKDVTSTKVFSVMGTTVSDAGTVAKKMLTIDGNGHKLTFQLARSGWAFTLKDAAVTFTNLKIFTSADGFTVSGASTAIFNNCDVYTGNTQPNVDLEGVHSNKGELIKTDSERAYVEINGGDWKGTGTAELKNAEDPSKGLKWTNATVFGIVSGRCVITAGTFTSYNTNVLFQVGNATAKSDIETTAAGAWIYGGTFLRKTSDYNAANGIVVRSYRTGVLTIYDGTFVGYTMDNAKGASVIGAHSNGGCLTYVLGGNFYNLSSNVKSMLMTDNAGENAPKNLIAYIYGGTFYSLVVDKKDEEGVVTEENVRVEENMDGTNGTIRNFDDVVYAATMNTNVELTAGEVYKVNKYTYDYKYDATNAKAGAKIKVTNPDNKVYYTDNLWAALNCIAQNGATVTLLDNIELAKECWVMARHGAKITLDGNGKTISCAADVKNALRVQGSELVVKNATLVNNGGSVFSFGYSPADLGNGEFEQVTFGNTTVNVTVNGSTITSSGDAWAVQFAAEGTLKFEGTCTVNGAAPAETTVTLVAAPVAPAPDGGDGAGDGDGTGEGNTGNTNTDDKKEENKDDGAKDTAPVEKKGCGGFVGAGAVAVVAVAGLACALTSKRRED